MNILIKVILRNISSLYMGRHKLCWDDTKRVDRVCTGATELKKKEEKLGWQFSRMYLNISLATS